MLRRVSVQPSAVALAAAVLVATLPASAVAQPDSSDLHWTLEGWAEHSWLRIEDRNGAVCGRMCERGFLQRFHKGMHREYPLDLVNVRFAMEEDYGWWARDDGIRWNAGSLNKVNFAVRTQFKTRAHLSDAWSLGVRFDQYQNFEEERAFLRVDFARHWKSGLLTYIGGSLDREKEGSDLEFGVGWRSREGPKRQALVGLALLDFSNDFIYVNLDAAIKAPVDSTIEYKGQPVALRGSVEWPFGRHLRVEAYAGVMPTSTVWYYKGIDTDSGFSLVERFTYAGALAEWSASPRLRVGAFAWIARARSERTALSVGATVDEYNLLEQNARAGAYALWRALPKLTLEAWVAREWRPERRLYLDGSNPDVDYLDHTWTGQVLLRWTPARGFVADLGVPFDLRDVVRGQGELPYDPGNHNYRIRGDFGWRFSDKVMFLMGAAFEPMGDGVGRYFGGGRGRFVVYW